MKLLGIKDDTFTNKDGEVVSYLHLHVCDKDEKVDGLAVEILKVAPKNKEAFLQILKTNGIKPNDDVVIIYDKFGKPIDIKKA